jgi:UDP-glucose 4-epimerase
MKAQTVDRFYNVGTGTRTSLRQLAEMLLEITGSDQTVRYAPRSQATLVRNRIGSPARARLEIGFNADIGLHEGLRRLIDWRASHKADVEARQRDVGILV